MKWNVHDEAYWTPEQKAAYGKPTSCPVREGTKCCPWYVVGCIHPDPPEQVSPNFSEVKKVCRGILPRTKEAKISANER